MFTWKRISIAFTTLAVAFLVLEFTNAPKIIAQTVKPALVRSVDEPARVPYFISAYPTCPFGNECFVKGPAVPAGKRLRVTRLMAEIPNQGANITGFFSVNDDSTPVFMFPSNVFGQAFFGNGVSFNQEVDFYFEAGQSPVLGVVCPAGMGGVSRDLADRLTIVGYIVDTTP